MKEASRVKFYFAKYFFLAFGLLQWTCGALLMINAVSSNDPRGPLIFFFIGLIFICLHILIASKLKRVAIGKKKIVVINRNRQERYEWPEVKSIKVVPYFNLYKLKLRGRKGRIYFLPDQTLEPLFGLFPKEPELADVLKKKLK